MGDYGELFTEISLAPGIDRGGSSGGGLAPRRRSERPVSR